MKPGGIERDNRTSSGPVLSRVDCLALFASRLGPAGKMPYAPGTAGALAATVAAPWLYLPLPMWARILVLCVVFLLGGVAAGRAERILGRKDPGEVVLDELLGQWVTFTAFETLGLGGLALGLLFFRIFDIAKPWPVRASEHWLPKGYGVMIDDVVAGLFAMLLLVAAKAIWPAL